MKLADRVRGSIWNVPVGLQLSLIYAALVAATLALLGWALYAQLDNFLVQSTAERLGRLTSSDMHSPPPPRGSADQGASFLVHQLSEQDTNVSVAVLNTQGQVLSSSQATSGGEPVSIPALPVDWTSKVINGSPVQWVVDGADGNRQLVVLTAITLHGPPGRADTPLYLEEVASLAAADAVLNQLRLYILLGILIGTAIGIVAGLALTRLTLRPLDRMVRTAEAIAGGDLDRRLRLPAGRNEVARLGSAFDHMVDRLGTALEAQRRFVADASHELRTPLTSLEGLSEMLLIGADRGDTSVIQRSVRAMYKELARLGRLVTDLLTLSRLDSAAPMTFKPLDVSRLVTEVADQMRPLAEARQVHLATVYSQPVVVQAEPDRLKQVVLNLVDNAIRYTPPDGQVELSTSRDAQTATARIDVTDTGPGIAPEDQSHIFERFYRADPARTRANGNTGLGLAIARAIVQAHGGMIGVHSVPGTGTGARFTVILPANNPGEEPAPHEREAEVP
jgi:two-component system OmpR family sensor kinase